MAPRFDATTAPSVALDTTPIADRSPIAIVIPKGADSTQGRLLAEAAIAEAVGDPSNLAVLEQVFKGFDPVQCGRGGAQQSEFFVLAAFFKAHGDVQFDGKKVIGGSIPRELVSLSAELRKFVAEKSAVAAPLAAPTGAPPVVDGIDGSDGAKGKTSDASGPVVTDGLTPSAAGTPKEERPLSASEVETKLQAAQDDLGALHKQLEAKTGNPKKLHAEISAKQAEIGKLKEEKNLFVFGTPVRDATSAAAIAEQLADVSAGDKKLAAAMDALTGKSKDPGRAMLALFDLHPSATNDKRPILERLAGQAEATNALALDIQRYVATGELTPALQEIIDAAQTPPRGTGPKEVTAFNDAVMVATFLYRVKAHNLNEARSAAEHELHTAQSSKSLTPERKKEHIAALTAKVKQLRAAESAVQTAYQPIGSAARGYEAHYISVVASQASGAHRRANDLLAAGDVAGAAKLDAQAKTQGDAVVASAEAHWKGALAAKDYGRAANAAAGSLASAYKFLGDVEVDRASASAPLLGADVPSYKAAREKLNELPESQRMGAWKAAEGTVARAQGQATEKWSVAKKYDAPGPSAAELKALRETQDAAVAAAAVKSGKPLSAADAQKLRDGLRASWDVQRDHDFHFGAPTPTQVAEGAHREDLAVAAARASAGGKPIDESAVRAKAGATCQKELDDKLVTEHPRSTTELEAAANARVQAHDFYALASSDFSMAFHESAAKKNPSAEDLVTTTHLAVDMNGCNADASRTGTRLERDQASAAVSFTTRRENDPQSVGDAELGLKRAQEEVNAANDATLGKVGIHTDANSWQKKIAQAHVAGAQAKIALARELDATPSPDPVKIAEARQAVAKAADDAQAATQGKTSSATFHTEEVRNRQNEDAYVRRATSDELARADGELGDAKDPVKTARADELRANAEALAKAPVQLVGMHDANVDAKDSVAWASAHLAAPAQAIDAQRVYTSARSAQTELLHDGNALSATYQQKAVRDAAERDRQMHASLRYGKAADELHSTNAWQTSSDKWVTRGLIASVPLPIPGAGLVVAGALSGANAGPGTDDAHPGVVRWLFDTKIGQAAETETRALSASANSMYRQAKDDAAHATSDADAARANAAVVAGDLAATNDVIDAHIAKLPDTDRDTARLESVSARGDLAVQAAATGRADLVLPSLEKAAVQRDAVSEPHARVIAFESLAATSIDAKLALEQGKNQAARDAQGHVITDAKTGQAKLAYDTETVAAVFARSAKLTSEAEHISDKSDPKQPLDAVALQKPLITAGMSDAQKAHATALADSVAAARDRLVNARGADALRELAIAAMSDPEFQKTELARAQAQAHVQSARDRATFDRSVSEVDGMVVGLLVMGSSLKGDFYDAVIPDALRSNSFVRDVLLLDGVIVKSDGSIKDGLTAALDGKQAETDAHLDEVFTQMGQSWATLSATARALTKEQGPSAGRIFLARALAAAGCDDPGLRAAAIADVQSFAAPLARALPALVGTTPDAGITRGADKLDASGVVVTVPGVSPLGQSLLTLSVQAPELANALLEAKNLDDVHAALARFAETLPAGAKAVLEKSDLVQWTKFIDDNRTALTICAGVIDMLPALLVGPEELGLDMSVSASALVGRATAVVAEYVPRVAQIARYMAEIIDKYPELQAFLRFSQSSFDMWLTTKLQKGLGEIGDQLGGANGQKIGGFLGQYMVISTAAKAQAGALTSARHGLQELETHGPGFLRKALWPALSMAYDHGIVANIRDPERAAIGGKIGEGFMIFGPASEGAVLELIGATQARANTERFCTERFPNEPGKAKELLAAIDKFNATYKVTTPSREEVVKATDQFNASAEKIGLPEHVRAELRDTQLADWAVAHVIGKTGLELDSPAALAEAHKQVAANLAVLKVPELLAQTLAAERMRPLLAQIVARASGEFSALQRAAAETLIAPLAEVARDQNMSPVAARRFFQDAGKHLGLARRAADKVALQALEHYEGAHLADQALGSAHTLSDEAVRGLSAIVAKEGATHTMASFAAELAKNPALAKLPAETQTQLAAHAVLSDSLARFEGTLIEGAKANRPDKATASFAAFAKEVAALPVTPARFTELKQRLIEKAALDAFKAQSHGHETPRQTIDGLRAHLETLAGALPSGVTLATDALVARAGISYAMESLAENKVPLTRERVAGQLLKLGISGPAADAELGRFSGALTEVHAAVTISAPAISAAPAPSTPAARADAAVDVLDRIAPPEIKEAMGIEYQGPVAEVVRDAYAHGLEIPPAAFDYTGEALSADPRHVAFMAHAPELVAHMDAPPLAGDKKHVSGKIERYATSEGELFTKTGESARKEVLASRVAQLFVGVEIIPLTTFRTLNGEVVSAQRAVPEGFRPASNKEEMLLTDPRFADGLSNLRALDYVLASGDRHSKNIYINETTGQVMAIDNDLAMGGVIPPAMTKANPLSGGILPEHYTAEFRAALSELTPDKIRSALKDIASPAEIDAAILRADVVRRDMAAKDVRAPAVGSPADSIRHFAPELNVRGVAAPSHEVMAEMLRVPAAAPKAVAEAAGAPLIHGKIEVGPSLVPVEHEETDAGSSAEVRLGTLPSGQKVALKIIHRNGTGGYGREHAEIFLREVEGRKRVADLLPEARPKFYGVVDLGDGSYAFAMGIVDGGPPERMGAAVSDATVQELRSHVDSLHAAGVDIRDFQYMVDKEGHINLIDVGGIMPLAADHPPFMKANDQARLLRVAQSGEVLVSDARPDGVLNHLDKAGDDFERLSPDQRTLLRARAEEVRQHPGDFRLGVTVNGERMVVIEMLREADGSYQEQAYSVAHDGGVTPLHSRAFEANGALAGAPKELAAVALDAPDASQPLRMSESDRRLAQDKLSAMPEKQMLAFAKMLADARERSPAHAELLAHMLARGFSFEKIADTFTLTRELSATELEHKLSPIFRQQHDAACNIAAIDYAFVSRDLALAEMLGDPGQVRERQTKELESRHATHTGFDPMHDAQIQAQLLDAYGAHYEKQSLEAGLRGGTKTVLDATLAAEKPAFFYVRGEKGGAHMVTVLRTETMPDGASSYRIFDPAFGEHSVSADDLAAGRYRSAVGGNGTLLSLLAPEPQGVPRAFNVTISKAEQGLFTNARVAIFNEPKENAPKANWLVVRSRMAEAEATSKTSSEPQRKAAWAEKALIARIANSGDGLAGEFAAETLAHLQRRAFETPEAFAQRKTDTLSLLADLLPPNEVREVSELTKGRAAVKLVADAEATDLAASTIVPGLVASLARSGERFAPVELRDAAFYLAVAGERYPKLLADIISAKTDIGCAQAVRALLTRGHLDLPINGATAVRGVEEIYEKSIGGKSFLIKVGTKVELPSGGDGVVVSFVTVKGDTHAVVGAASARLGDEQIFKTVPWRELIPPKSLRERQINGVPQGKTLAPGGLLPQRPAAFRPAPFPEAASRTRLDRGTSADVISNASGARIEKFDLVTVPGQQPGQRFRFTAVNVEHGTATVVQDTGRSHVMVPREIALDALQVLNPIRRGVEVFFWDGQRQITGVVEQNKESSTGTLSVIKLASGEVREVPLASVFTRTPPYAVSDTVMFNGVSAQVRQVLDKKNLVIETAAGRTEVVSADDLASANPLYRGRQVSVGDASWGTTRALGEIARVHEGIVDIRFGNGEVRSYPADQTGFVRGEAVIYTPASLTAQAVQRFLDPVAAQQLLAAAAHTQHVAHTALLGLIGEVGARDPALARQAFALYTVHGGDPRILTKLRSALLAGDAPSLTVLGQMSQQYGELYADYQKALAARQPVRAEALADMLRGFDAGLTLLAREPQTPESRELTQRLQAARDPALRAELLRQSAPQRPRGFMGEIQVRGLTPPDAAIPNDSSAPTAQIHAELGAFLAEHGIHQPSPAALEKAFRPSIPGATATLTYGQVYRSPSGSAFTMSVEYHNAAGELVAVTSRRLHVENDAQGQKTLRFQREQIDRAEGGARFTDDPVAPAILAAEERALADLAVGASSLSGAPARVLISTQAAPPQGLYVWAKAEYGYRFESSPAPLDNIAPSPQLQRMRAQILASAAQFPQAFPELTAFSKTFADSHSGKPPHEADLASWAKQNPGWAWQRDRMASEMLAMTAHPVAVGEGHTRTLSESERQIFAARLGAAKEPRDFLFETPVAGQMLALGRALLINAGSEASPALTLISTWRGERELAVSEIHEASKAFAMLGAIQPRYTHPDPESLASARVKVSAGKLSALDAQQTRALMLDAALATQHAIVARKSEDNQSAVSPQEALSADGLSMWCGFAQAAAFHYLERALPGAKISAYQTSELFGGESASSHGIVVVEMPGGKKFLIDPTFRQVFGGDLMSGEGAAFAKSAAGRALAEPLGRDGYVELTESVLAEYAKNLGVEGQIHDIRVADFNTKKLPERTAAEIAAAEFSAAEMVPYLPPPPPDARALAAQQKLVTQFAAGGLIATRLSGSGILATGVNGPSAIVTEALGRVFTGPFASIDRSGAANVDHLASVFEGVLQAARKLKGSALSQAEVDQLALETVLTDATGKGRTPEELASMPTALLLDGHGTALPNTGGAFWAHAIATDPSFAKKGFLAGTLLHGIPHFSIIETAVAAAGGSHDQAQKAYEAVLGHHMAGFIADGMAKTGVTLDFSAMIRAGHLSSQTGERLKSLYASSLQLARAWRPIIDKTLAEGRVMSPEQHAAYAKDARALRAVMAQLRANDPHVYIQLTSDDSQQFTPVGIPKWLEMYAAMPPPKATNAELLSAVFTSAVTPYLWENEARGSSAELIATTAVAARRQGIHFDAATLSYRAARPTDSEYKSFAGRIASDPELAKEFLRVTRRSVAPDALAAQVDKDPALQTEIVEWMRTRATNTAELARLTADRPEENAVAKRTRAGEPVAVMRDPFPAPLAVMSDPFPAVVPKAPGFVLTKTTDGKTIVAEGALKGLSAQQRKDVEAAITRAIATPAGRTGTSSVAVPKSCPVTSEAAVRYFMTQEIDLRPRLAQLKDDASSLLQTVFVSRAESPPERSVIDALTQIITARELNVGSGKEGWLGKDTMRARLIEVLAEHAPLAVAAQQAEQILVRVAFVRAQSMMPDKLPMNLLKLAPPLELEPIIAAFDSKQKSVMFQSEFNSQVLARRDLDIAKENAKEIALAASEGRAPKPLTLTPEQAYARTKRAFFEVVIERLEALDLRFGETLPKLATLDDTELKVFYSAIAGGRLVNDKIFEGGAHGALPHIVQAVRFLELIKANGGTANKEAYAAVVDMTDAQGGSEVWDNLFDSFDSSSFSSPVTVTAMLDAIFPDGSRQAGVQRLHDVEKVRDARWGQRLTEAGVAPAAQVTVRAAWNSILQRYATTDQMGTAALTAVQSGLAKAKEQRGLAADALEATALALEAKDPAVTAAARAALAAQARTIASELRGPGDLARIDERLEALIASSAGASREAMREEIAQLVASHGGKLPQVTRPPAGGPPESRPLETPPRAPLSAGSTFTAEAAAASSAETAATANQSPPSKVEIRPEEHALHMQAQARLGDDALALRFIVLSREIASARSSADPKEVELAETNKALLALLLKSRPEGAQHLLTLAADQTVSLAHKRLVLDVVVRGGEADARALAKLEVLEAALAGVGRDASSLTAQTRAFVVEELTTLTDAQTTRLVNALFAPPRQDNVLAALKAYNQAGGDRIAARTDALVYSDIHAMQARGDTQRAKAVLDKYGSLDSDERATLLAVLQAPAAEPRAFLQLVTIASKEPNNDKRALMRARVLDPDIASVLALRAGMEKFPLAILPGLAQSFVVMTAAEFAAAKAEAATSLIAARMELPKVAIPLATPASRTRKPDDRPPPADAYDDGEGRVRAQRSGLARKAGVHGIARGAESKASADAPFERVVKDMGLDKDQRRRLHEIISGKNWSEARIREEAENEFARSRKNGNWDN